VALHVVHPFPSIETLEEQKEKNTKKYRHNKNMQASIVSFNWSP